MSYLNYKRNSIIISNKAIALIHLFTRNDNNFFEDIFLSDLIDECDDKNNNFETRVKKSARKYIDSLEGAECERFLNEIVYYIIEKKIELDKKYGTNHFKKLKKEINKLKM